MPLAGLLCPFRTACFPGLLHAGARDRCRAATHFSAPALVRAKGSSDFLAPQAPVCCTFRSPAWEIPVHPWAAPSSHEAASPCLPPREGSVCLVASLVLCSPRQACSPPPLPPQTPLLGDTQGEPSHVLIDTASHLSLLAGVVCVSVLLCLIQSLCDLEA